MPRKKPTNNDVEINKIIEQFLKNIADDFARLTDLEETETPIIYGFNIRFNQNNLKEPIINSFGNIKKDENEKIMLSEEREPLVDMIEKEDNITIIAEIPGVSKENIKIEIDPKEIHIDARDHNKNYNKDLELNSMVNTTPTSIQFKNGVLEIVLEKTKREFPKRIITIE
ncbi:MAG: Hsp20/alpha crystallin family protein [Candidatus Micrarchaeia archaeon]